MRAKVRAFLARFDHYCRTTERSEGGVSDALFGSARKVKDIRAGGGVGIYTLATAEDRLAALAAEAGLTLPETPAPAESGADSPRPRAVGE
ncbi:MAG TPA: hypothetical protein PLS69_00495 [Terricaulis sp.]|nr:hypothetical protein [Terricaulis sp.]